VDYGFLKAEDPASNRLTVTTAFDTVAGVSMAVVVTCKGETNYSTLELKRCLLECGRSRCVLQSDQESAIKLVLQSVAKDLGSTILRNAPVYHSQSQGGVERLHGTLFAQVRTLRNQVHKNYGVLPDDTSALIPWLVKHAAWLLNRYLVHADGKTSYYRRWEKNYERAICTFAETLLYRQPGTHRAKLQDQWRPGIWLGKDTNADEHLVGTSSGVYKVRSIRRLPPSQQHNKELLLQLSGTPWSPQGEGLNDNFIISNNTEPSLPQQLPEEQPTTEAADQPTEASDEQPMDTQDIQPVATSSSSSSTSLSIIRTPAPEDANPRPRQRLRLVSSSEALMPIQGGTVRQREEGAEDELEGDRRQGYKFIRIANFTTGDEKCWNGSSKKVQGLWRWPEGLVGGSSVGPAAPRPRNL